MCVLGHICRLLAVSFFEAVDAELPVTAGRKPGRAEEGALVFVRADPALSPASQAPSALLSSPLAPHPVWGPRWRSHSPLSLETPLICRRLRSQGAGLSGSYPESWPKSNEPSETTGLPSQTASRGLASALGLLPPFPGLAHRGCCGSSSSQTPPGGTVGLQVLTLGLLATPVQGEPVSRPCTRPWPFFPHQGSGLCMGCHDSLIVFWETEGVSLQGGAQGFLPPNRVIAAPFAPPG